MVRARGAFAQTIKGLQNALASPLYVMTNTTMLRTNAAYHPSHAGFPGRDRRPDRRAERADLFRAAVRRWAPGWLRPS